MLFTGLRLLVSNWRLTLVQILPAMWIWLAMFDLKAHTLHGNSFNVLRGPVLIPIGLLIVILTVASYFLNAVFAFAISQPGRPRSGRPLRGRAVTWAPISVRAPMVGRAARGRDHGGAPLGATLVRGLAGHRRRRDDGQLRGRPGPAHRGKRKQSRRDKLLTSVVGGALGRDRLHAAVPPRQLGILMLGSSLLVIPGIFVLALGVTLQAGATGAVRAIKMSVSLTTAGRPSPRATEQS